MGRTYAGVTLAQQPRCNVLHLNNPCWTYATSLAHQHTAHYITAGSFVRLCLSVCLSVCHTLVSSRHESKCIHNSMIFAGCPNPIIYVTVWRECHICRLAGNTVWWHMWNVSSGSCEAGCKLMYRPSPTRFTLSLVKIIGLKVNA